MTVVTEANCLMVGQLERLGQGPSQAPSQAPSQPPSRCPNHPNRNQLFPLIQTPRQRLPKLTEMRLQPPPKLRIQPSLVPLSKLLKSPKATEMRQMLVPLPKSPKATEMRQQPPPKLRIQPTLVPLHKLLKLPKSTAERQQPPPKVQIGPPI